MTPEEGPPELFRTHVLALQFQHKMYRIARWKKENRKAFLGGIWGVSDPCLDCVTLFLIGSVQLGKSQKKKRVPLPLFEKWVNKGIAREVTGKS